MTTQIDWNDGSGDKIYLSYSASEGNQNVAVSSDANTGLSRSKEIQFKVVAGGQTITKTLTVEQEGRPPYDSKVEYIATNADAYIDLGIRCNAATDAIFVDFQATTEVKQARLFARNATNSPCQIYVNGSLGYGFRQGSSWAAVPVGSTVGLNRHTWLCDYYNKVNVVDGVSYNMSAASTGTGTSNWFLVGPYTSNNRFKGRIYAAKIYRSGELIMDLIPVRVGTTAYMYDKIGKSLLGNAGTNAFTYGNDIT